LRLKFGRPSRLVRDGPGVGAIDGDTIKSHPDRWHFGDHTLGRGQRTTTTAARSPAIRKRAGREQGVAFGADSAKMRARLVNQVVRRRGIADVVSHSDAGSRETAMKRLLGAMVALIMTLACGAAFAHDMMDIRIGAATASDHAPGFAGLERGIFAKHGLNAEIVMYPTGVEMINGLMAGAQEVNLMGSIPFLAAISNGLPLMLIGHLHGDPLSSSYSTGHSIVAGPDAGVAGGDVKALDGKRIGLPRGTGAEGYLLGHLKSNDMTADDVELVNIKPADLATALAQGDVDAIAIWEPWPSTAVVNVPGAVRVVDGGCESCYIPAAILTTRQVIADQPELLRRFLAAFAESQQWVRKNFDEAAEINMRWIPGIDLAVMKAAIRQAGYDHRISKLTLEGYQEKTMPSLVAGGRLKEVFDASPNIDPQFYLHVEESFPELYADLPPIPEDIHY
jgi:sulfonate transport system substrate-binding protein